MAEPNDPVMVIGGGAIALRTTQELCRLQVYRVVVLSQRDPTFACAVEDAVAVFIAAVCPDSAEAFDRAGVTRTVTTLALAADDQLDLHAALLTRRQSTNSYRVAAIQPGPRPVRSTRIVQTARSYRWLGTRPPMQPLRSSAPASAGCNSPNRTVH